MMNRDQRTVLGRARVTLPAWILALCSFFLCGDPARSQQTSPIAYMGGNSVFGAINLRNGQFTQLGGAFQYLGLGEVNGTLYTINNTGLIGSLYTVNPVNGRATLVGSTGLAVGDFGSTTSGLYALDNYVVSGSLHLYSINPTTGAATLIGPNRDYKP